MKSRSLFKIFVKSSFCKSGSVVNQYFYPRNIFFSCLVIELFTVYTKLAEMALLASKDLRTAKKLPPVGLDLMKEIITGLRVNA